jgi:hypothetical protein
MNKKTLALAALLLATAGCGKYAAAIPLGHGADTRPEQATSTKEKNDDPPEPCRWNRRLFC